MPTHDLNFSTVQMPHIIYRHSSTYSRPCRRRLGSSAPCTSPAPRGALHFCWLVRHRRLYLLGRPYLKTFFKFLRKSSTGCFDLNRIDQSSGSIKWALCHAPLSLMLCITVPHFRRNTPDFRLELVTLRHEYWFGNPSSRIVSAEATYCA